MIRPDSHANSFAKNRRMRTRGSQLDRQLGVTSASICDKLSRDVESGSFSFLLEIALVFPSTKDVMTAGAGTKAACDRSEGPDSRQGFTL